MGGLGHVSSVQAVVVGHIRVVVVLQGHHVRHERVRRDLEGFQQIPLLRGSEHQHRESGQAGAGREDSGWK